MCVRSNCGEILEIHGILKGCRGQSRENTSYSGASPTEDGQGGAEPEWQDSSTKQVRLKGDG